MCAAVQRFAGLEHTIPTSPLAAGLLVGDARNGKL